jgi:AraC-like DNA-binding protein
MKTMGSQDSQCQGSISEHLDVLEEASIALRLVSRSTAGPITAVNSRLRALIVQLLISALQATAVLCNPLDAPEGDGVTVRAGATRASHSISLDEHAGLLQLPEERLRALEHLVNLFAQTESSPIVQHALANRTDDPSSVTRAKELIRTDFTQSLTTYAVARRVHLSPDHLSRIFKRATGMTLCEYVVAVRVERAKRLIADPSLRICDAAYQSGFESIPYFNRMFKRLTGTSPTEYRELARVRSNGSRNQ